MIHLRRWLFSASVPMLLIQALPASAQQHLHLQAPSVSGCSMCRWPQRDDPRAGLYILDHLAPGATIHRRIEISSGLDRPERIALYSAGALISKGHFRFLDGHTQDELSSWIEVEPASVMLPPRGAATAVVTIRVPPDAVQGERYAVVWAETPPSLPATGGVATVSRVGIRVYQSVGLGAPHRSTFRSSR